MDNHNLSDQSKEHLYSEDKRLSYQTFWKRNRWINVVLVLAILIEIIILLPYLYSYSKISAPKTIQNTSADNENPVMPTDVPTLNLKNPASWKTYSKNGVSFQYPKNWFIEETADFKSVPSGFDNWLTVLTDPTQYTQYKNLRPCKVETKEQTLCLGGVTESVENISVNENTARSFYIQGVNMGDLDLHVVQIDSKNGQSAQISTGIFVEGTDSIFNQILSTFKFLN